MMLGEQGREAVPSEANLTQDLGFDDATSVPPITTDGMRDLFLGPRDTSERNYQENFPDSPLTESQAARPIQDLAGQGFFPGPHQGQPEPYKPQPGYQPADETSAGQSYWSPQPDQTRPSTRYSFAGQDIPDPDLAGAPQYPTFPPQNGGIPQPDRDSRPEYSTGTNQPSSDWSYQPSGSWQTPSGNQDFAAGPDSWDVA